MRVGVALVAGEVAYVFGLESCDGEGCGVVFSAEASDGAKCGVGLVDVDSEPVIPNPFFGA